MTFCAFLVLAVASPARAYVLGANQDFDFRLRAYSEAAVAAESSEPQTAPSRVPFQLIEHRNFFNPELDGKLTRYQPFHLDDLSFRLALWGFYDGIYDYGTGQYARAIESIQGRLSQGHTNTAPITHTDTRSTRARSTSISPIPSWVVTVTYLSASTSRCWRAAERPGPGSLLAPWPSARAPPSRQPRRRALAPDRALSSQ